MIAFVSFPFLLALTAIFHLSCDLSIDCLEETIREVINEHNELFHTFGVKYVTWFSYRWARLLRRSMSRI